MVMEAAPSAPFIMPEPDFLLELLIVAFDQQPFFGELINRRVCVRNANAQARKARGQHVGRAFPPFDRLPSRLRQTERDLLDRDQVGIAAPSPLRRFTAWLGSGAGPPHQR